MIRGYIQKRRFIRLKLDKVFQTSNNRFKIEEYWETLEKGEKYDNTLELKMKKHIYPNNSVYLGQMRGGYRDGQGKMTWSDGTIFEGEWAEGFATGYGILNLPHGGSYQGNWLNNKYHG